VPFVCLSAATLDDDTVALDEAFTSSFNSLNLSMNCAPMTTIAITD